MLISVQRAVAVTLLTLSAVSFAQEPLYPGPNRNIVGPPPADSSALADTGNRQQNEPSCAVDPDNTDRICCGFNDYRGVDVPGLEEAWEGLSCSIDGGSSWASQLIPGHRLDPQYSLGLEFAADPSLVSVPGGLIFNFLAADRDQAQGGLFVQRYLWRNKESGWPLEQVGGPVLVADGLGAKFIDKPHFYGFLDEGTEATVKWSGTDRDLPAGTLSLAAAIFDARGGSENTRLLYWRSTDWGETWTRSLTFSPRGSKGSGLSIAANASKTCVVWRQFTDGVRPDAIYKSCLNHGASRFGPSRVISEVCPFDQTTLSGEPPLDQFVSFRSNAFPVIATDGQRFYTFWSDRGYAAASGGPAGCELVVTDPGTGEEVYNPSFARIVYTVSSDDGETWSAPTTVEDNNSGIFPGHQFMPAAFGANGEVLLAWIDSRDDVTNQYRALGFDPDIDKQLIVDFWDGETALYRHSTDIRSVRLKAGQVQGGSQKVSSYAHGLVDLGSGPQLTQLEYNLVNARLFKKGTAPFVGDYLNVTARSYNQDETGKWHNSNSRPVPGSPVFHVSWGDNRDLRGNAWGGDGFNTPSPYTPVAAATSSGAANSTEETSNATPGVQDPPDDLQLSCEAAAEPADRTRDQNVYSAAVYPSISINSPGGIKLSGLDPTGTQPLRRAIPVIVRNHSPFVREISVRIDAQPADGLASFAQDGSLVTDVPVTVWGRSSAVRTIFVSTASAEASKSIPVSATVCDAGGGCSSTPVASTLLNGSNLELEQPDSGASSVLAQETHDPSILNPALLNPDVVRVLLQDPSLLEVLKTAGVLPQSFALEDLFNVALVDSAMLALLQGNPDLLSPENLNPDLVALLLANPNFLSSGVYAIDPSNPGSLNPTLLNPNLLNQALWDLLREDDNLSLLVDGVQNPNLLNYLAQNPNLLNPNLLNLLVENPNLLNPNLLNILVANPTLLNYELANPNLLNPNLLNTIVSNPNLLNPGVIDGMNALASDPDYPDAGTKEEQFTYVQDNYAAIFPDLINAVAANPTLLNPNLLNPTLLNPTLLNSLVANPNLLNPNLLNPNLLNPNLLNPNLLNPNLLNPDLLNPDLLNQVLLNPNLLNAIVANPNLLNPNLLNPNLLNPDLLNLVLANPNLLNPNLLNPNLLNPNLLNPNLLNTTLDSYSDLENSGASEAPAGVTPGEDYYVDLTWQVKNDGNTTTGYMTQPYVASAVGDGGGITGTQLIISKPYLRQTVKDCQPVLETYNNVVVNIPNPRSGLPLQNPDAADPSTEDVVQGLGSFWLAPGEVANVTMRVFGQPEALNTGSVGLYVNSEACTSGVESATCTEELPFVAIEPDIAEPVFEEVEVFLEQFQEPTEAQGPEGAVVFYEPPIVVDEGGAVSIDCELPSGALFPVGTSDHECVASDPSGNTASQPFEVTVEDSKPPSITVVPPVGLKLPLEAMGPEGAQVTFTGGDDNDWVFGSEDVDGVDPNPEIACYLLSQGGETRVPVPISGTFTFPVGDNTLSCESEDDSGNVSDAVDISIPVVDTVPPQLTLVQSPEDLLVEAAGPSGTEVMFDLTAEDLVDGPLPDSSINCSVASGSLFPLGTTAVDCSAADAAGNISEEVSFDVTVVDTMAPVLLLPANILLEASSSAGAVAVFSASASDAIDGPVAVACAPLLDYYPIGATFVTCNASDNSGNVAAGTFSITVNDTAGPALIVPGDFVVEADTPDGSTVSFEVSATDLGETLPVSCSPDSGDTFPIGLTTVTCSVADSVGNTSTAFFTVSVQDSVPPVLKIPADIEKTVPVSEIPLQVFYEVTAMDAASSEVEVTCVPSSGSGFDVGETRVNCTARDNQGLESEGSFLVVVNEEAVETSNIVWIFPWWEDTVYAPLGSKVNVFWGYGALSALEYSKNYIKTGPGRTDPASVSFLGDGNSCSGPGQEIEFYSRDKLHYHREKLWHFSWRTGKSKIANPLGIGKHSNYIGTGCYELSIPRVDGTVDKKRFILF